MQTVDVKHGEVVRQTCSEPCRCDETASSRGERHHLIPAVCAVGVHMKQQHPLLQCDIVARLLDSEAAKGGKVQKPHACRIECFGYTDCGLLPWLWMRSHPLAGLRTTDCLPLDP